MLTGTLLILTDREVRAWYHIGGRTAQRMGLNLGSNGEIDELLVAKVSSHERPCRICCGESHLGIAYTSRLKI